MHAVRENLLYDIYAIKSRAPQVYAIMNLCIDYHSPRHPRLCAFWEAVRHANGLLIELLVVLDVDWMSSRVATLVL